MLLSNCIPLQLLTWVLGWKEIDLAMYSNILHADMRINTVAPFLMQKQNSCNNEQLCQWVEAKANPHNYVGIHTILQQL